MSNPPAENESPVSLRKIGWFRVLVAILSMGPLGLFVATQMGKYSFLCELLSNFQLFVFFLLLPTTLLVGWFAWRKLTIILGVATLISFWMVASVYLPRFQPQKGERIVKIMSYNVLALNPNHADALRVIEDADPDMLMVVEYSNQWTPAMKILKEKYPHRVESPRWHGFGIAFCSKLPIVEHEVIQLAKKYSDNPVIVAKVKVGEQTLRVVGVHVTSPINVERLSLRNLQLKDLAEYLAQSTEPTVLVGDFNCTVWSPYLKDLMKTAKLSDSRQGFGYLASWNANDWPFQIPIDHALISDNVHVHSRRVGSDSGGSDHFPIFCDVSISPE